jgi:hypothetical protein
LGSRDRMVCRPLLQIVFAFAVVVIWQRPVLAVSTGNLTGTVSAESGAVVAGAAVSAVSPSGTYSAASDRRGFYSILNVPPDTYQISVSAAGYRPTITSGVTLYQNQNIVVNAMLQSAVASLGRVTVKAANASLVQPGVTSDTYNMNSTIQRMVLNDPTHHSLADLLYRTPGITAGPANGVPVVRGGIWSELGFEFDEVPVTSRITGYPTTFGQMTGLSNVGVTTGGLAADQGQSNGGIINMVVKRGSFQQKGNITFAVGGPAYDHTLDFEYGTATPDNRWSLYVAGSYTNVDQTGGDRNVFYYENVAGLDWQNAKDTTGNIHYRWGVHGQNDLQYAFDVGVWVDGYNYGGRQGTQLAVVGEDPNSTTAPGCSVAAPCMAELLAARRNAADLYRSYTVQKLAYSAAINERSYLRARVAQSLAGYTYDGEWAQNIGEPCLVNACTFAQGYYSINDMWCYSCYYQIRHSLQTFYNVDYANQLNAHDLVKFGVGYEYDSNLRKVAAGLGATDPNTGAYLGWPFFNQVTLAPTELYGAYASDHIAFGRWVVEPGLRWDLEHYSISPVQVGGVDVAGTGTPFSASFVSPRLAATYQPDPADVLRASYGHLGQFIPSAFVENYGPAMYFGSDNVVHYSAQKPSVASSYDLSWEHLFPHAVSMRLTPYVHNNDDYPEEYTQFHGPTVIVYGVSTHTKGVELGISREVADGLSTFVSLTYDDTKSNAPDFGGNIFGGGDGANIQVNNLQPASWAAAFSSNVSLDWKHAGWEITSNTLFTTANPYGLGTQQYQLDGNGNPTIVQLVSSPTNPMDGAPCAESPAGRTQCLDNAELGRFAQDLRGPASFLENLSIAHPLGPGEAGLTIDNLFNNIGSPIPTPNGNYLNGYTTGNWMPQGDCPPPSQWRPCGAAVYPAPNAYVYPATGYYSQQNQIPRQIRFWYTLKL